MKEKIEFKETTNGGMSQEAKMIVVVVTLVLLYPVGIVLMLMWMKWPWWVKMLLMIPLVLIVLAIGLGLLVAVALVKIDPAGQIQRAKMIKLKSDCSFVCNRMELEAIENRKVINREDCISACIARGDDYVDQTDVRFLGPPITP